ncbi:hypothetical protein ACQ4PT_032616 [Festuca glaucescens]
MAFFVGPYPPSMPTDAFAGHLALFNNRDNPANTYFPRTVGVEFDTFRNPDWDPNVTDCHIGINVNSIRSTQYTALPGGIFNGIMSAEVRYDAEATVLSATLRFLDPPGQGTYTVSANVDLQDADLPHDAAVGFSAAIGDLIEQHQILSWSFESSMIDSKTKNIGLIAGLVSAGLFVLLAIVAWLSYRQYFKRKDIASEDAEIPLDQEMDNEFEKGASAETDVYSFGVVVLEVACGRRPAVPQEDESKVVLVDWVWRLYGMGTILDAVDARLDGEFDAREVERALVVGLWCVHPDYGFRPSIRQVMGVLQFEGPLPDLPPGMPAAMYAPPRGGSVSSHTSLTGSSGAHGYSSTSDRTDKSRSFATADTRSDEARLANQTAGTTENVQFRNYTS